MSTIKIIQNPSPSELEEKGVFSWSIWSHPEAEFPWMYTDDETCYFLEGSVTVTPKNGEPVTMGKGDLVTFPKGMECNWLIHQDVKKHYRFG